MGECGTPLKTFYDTAVASAVLVAVICWGCRGSVRDRKRLNKLMKRQSSVVDCSLDFGEEVGERRMLAKLTSDMENTSHPLHETVGALSQRFPNFSAPDP